MAEACATTAWLVTRRSSATRLLCCEGSMRVAGGAEPSGGGQAWLRRYHVRGRQGGAWRG